MSAGGGWVPSIGCVGNRFSQLGRAAKAAGSALNQGVQNVAENLEGALVTFGEGQAERAGCVTRTSSFDSLVGEESPISVDPSPSEAGPGDEGSERERLFQSQAASGSMGCGSSQSSPTDPIAASTSSDPTAMLCDMCSIKFTLMTRKKLCCECSNYFCSNCLPREQGCRTRTCSRCRVLHKSPPMRGDLMKLRVKDLQHFLSKRQINIKACVEKKDLVELVVQHAGGEAAAQQGEDERVGGPRLPGSRSWEDASIRVSDQVPLERSGNFPQNYTDSSHRRDWFQEKFGPNSESSTPSDTEEPEVSMEEATPVERLHQSDSEVEETKVEELDMTDETIKDPSDDAHMVEADEIISVVVDDEDAVADSDNVSDPSVQAASDVANEDIVEKMCEKDEELVKAKEVVEEAMEATESVPTANPIEEEEEESSEGAVGGVPLPPSSMAGSRLGMPLLGEQDVSSTPSSPRRFANQGMVYLSEIESVEDLRELSTKQIKELLAMNRYFLSTWIDNNCRQFQGELQRLCGEK